MTMSFEFIQENRFFYSFEFDQLFTKLEAFIMENLYTCNLYFCKKLQISALKIQSLSSLQIMNEFSGQLLYISSKI